ncbi:MAG: glycosyltransferase family 4 protein [Chloroflexota bacterium]
MKVALNGLFLAQPYTGSGQYTRHLVEYLDETSTGDLELVVGRQPVGSNLAKTRWEQLGWPVMAARSGASLMHSPYFALPLRRPVPAVVTIHDLIPMILPAYRGSALVRVYTWLQALACRSAAAIIADSEATRRDVIRLLKVPPERVRVVYLGVEARFSPDRSGPRPIDRPYIFYLGGWDQRKNVAALIRAFARVSRQFPDLTLAIAGHPGSGGRLFPDPRPVAEPLGNRVRFLGRVTEEEKLALYRHAAAFVFPSLYEGFGLDPLEALACGCPVVCSNASSLPEVVGDAAALVNARDERELAQAMELVLRDPEPWRQRGPIRAASFTWQRTAAETLAVYRQVAA